MPRTSGEVAIVDDDAAMRSSLARLLRAGGYSTIAFASAEEFLESPMQGVVCLVLDIQLGGMSGIELRSHLSAAGSTIPVVFITAHEDEATRVKALAAGCVAYLRKPFDPDRLFEALERGMRRDS